MTQPTDLQPLIDECLRRHGGVNTMLFYGACLRSGRLDDGIVDLYLIVDRYRDCYQRWWPALANWLLPPNVFYLEIESGGQHLRCKYTVISCADFGRGARRWFESYIWGRFTQPAEIVYSRDRHSRERLEVQLFDCSVRFLRQVLPRLPAQGTATDLWSAGLRLSYGSELRAEGVDRARELVAADREFYIQRLRDAAGYLPFALDISPAGDDLHYHARIPATTRMLGRIHWPLRRLQGKLLSLLRVTKALFTFEGGLDYLAWKLARHSGQTVEVPALVRRYPLLFVWGWAWRLYRRGIFR